MFFLSWSIIGFAANCIFLLEMISFTQFQEEIDLIVQYS